MGMAFGAITNAEVDCYCRLYGLTFTPWELDTIRALDAEWLTANAERQKQESAKASASVSR